MFSLAFSAPYAKPNPVAVITWRKVSKEEDEEEKEEEEEEEEEEKLDIKGEKEKKKY